MEATLAERDQEALTILDPDFREGQKQGRAQAWGEQYPAATDWMRRDARELTWRERERRRWAEDDRTAFDERAPLVGGLGSVDAAGEDDWRVDEFRDLLEKEKNMRTQVYKWWLGVWDASGDDYLYDDDYQNRLDFDRGFESARKELRDRWEGRDLYAAAEEEEEQEDDAKPRRGGGSRGKRSSGRAPREEGRGSAMGSRAEYVDGRLERLESKVDERAAELEEEEAALSKRYKSAQGELETIQAEIRASGEMAGAIHEMQEELAAESRGARSRLKAAERACEELASERMTLWASLDEVESKLAEIRDARAILRRGGLRGLRAMMQRGRASKSLRTFLEKLL